MLKQLYVLTLFLFCRCFFSFASDGKSFIKFTENKGQWDANVLFRAQLDGGVLFLENKCFTYNFYEKEKVAKNHIRPSNSQPTEEELEIRSHAFRVNLKNALTPQSVRPEKRSTTYSNFFIGNNPQKWASHAYDYETVYYKDIYSGIDLEVNGKDNSMKYNFIVHPGADATKICLSYEGIKEIMNENGSLKIVTPLTTIIESKPYAYQEVNGTRVTVPCHFTITGNEVTFLLPENYRSDIPLVIDPTLIFSSYSGSFANNFGMTATFDNFGNLYAGGTAFSQGYPTTPNVFDSTYNGVVTFGRTDVVITKYDSSGSNRLYSTYLGGSSSTEIVTSLIVNSSNELMLFGMTGSADFPVTPTAFNTVFKGGDPFMLYYNGTFYNFGTDIYVAKFSVNGDSLLASTFVGGTENDGVIDSGATLQINYGDYYRGEIQTDAAGNFYVASTTKSNDFPVTSSAFDTSFGGVTDGCVFKMSPDLSQMLWCSYLGGSSEDASFALTLDKNKNVYVTGGTQGVGFPATAAAVNNTFIGGLADSYITKIKADGTAILNSTFMGTTQFDQSYFIQTDTLEHIYIFGQTFGSFPVIGNVYSNLGSKQFISILSNGLDTLLYSTVIGNGTTTGLWSPAAFLVDRCGNIYCSGWGGGVIPGDPPLFGLPVTPDAHQPASANVNDFYFCVLSPYLQLLQYGTYFGGAQSPRHVDGGTSRFDPAGILYQSVCAGCQNFDDFPTTAGVVSTVNNSTGCNNGVIKMDMNVQNTEAKFTAFPKSACPYINVTFTNLSIAGYNFYWDFGDGSPISNSTHATHAYSNAGTYYVSLVASSPFCGVDTAWDTINVYIPPIADFTNTGVYCERNTIQFNNGSAGTSPPLTYEWTFGDTDSTSAVNPSHIYSSPGNYTVTLIVVDSLGCLDTTIQNVNIYALPVASINYTVDTCALIAAVFGSPSNAASYFWDFGDAESDTLQNTSHTYDSSGTYIITLIVTDTIGCIDTATQTVAPYSFALADFVYDVDTCTFMVQFSNQSVNAIFNEWNFGDNSSISTATHPVHSFPAAGNYIVALVVNPGTGCVDTAYKNIYLDEHIFANYFIPNIFTPNGDPLNPKFTIKGLDFCDDFFLEIFNRWGELLFKSNNILDSWDGTYKGKDVPDGVYFYIIKGNRVNRAGAITVKRK